MLLIQVESSLSKILVFLVQYHCVLKSSDQGVRKPRTGLGELVRNQHFTHSDENE